MMSLENRQTYETKEKAMFKSQKKTKPNRCSSNRAKS